MSHEVKIGMTDYTVTVFIPDSASTDGSGKTGLVAANLTVSGTRVETDNDVTVTDYTSSLNNLAALTTAHTDWGLLEVSSTLAPGLYRLDIADAIFASGAWSAVVYVMVTTSAAAATPIEFILIPQSPIDGVLLAPTTHTSAVIPTVTTTGTATVVTTVNGLAAGVITAASIAADAITAAKIADGAIDAATFAANAITSTVIANDAITDAKVAADVTIASVTGAVGSVTGAVGSVTGNVGGNVTGTVGSVVGAVGSVTGNVGGNVTGTVGSVVGAVGSVTGNVGGNVVGSVASLTTNNDKTGYTLSATGSAALTEGYAADGAAFTLNQGLYMIWSLLAERAIASTTLTASKLDGTTPAMTFTLDSATTPATQTRAT